MVCCNRNTKMNKIQEYIKENAVVLIIMTLFFLIRIPFLDQVNLLHDERDISLSGYSIAQTGRDLSGNFLPLSIKNIAPDNPVVSIYYSALWWLILPTKTIFNARLPFVAISTLLIPLIYVLLSIITKDKKISIVTSIICCFSPWIFHISRLGMDVTLGFVTLLAAIILQLKNKKFLSYLFYFLSFYNYQGFRILIPFIIFYIIFFYQDKKNIYKNILYSGIFISVLFSSILLIDKDITQKRVTQIAFLNTTFFDNQIIFNRNTTLANPIIPPLFDNKLSAPINYVVSAFIKGLDFTYLFKDGDYSAINGSISGGQFFLSFLVFYFLGFFKGKQNLNRNYLFIVGFIPLGMLPALLSLNGVSFGIRGIFSSIGYAFIIANGLILGYEFLSKLKNKWIFYSAIFVFVFSISLNITHFGYTYYFRRPILVGELFNEHERKVSNLIIKNQNKVLQKIYTKNKDNMFKSYAFFNNKKPTFPPTFYTCEEYKESHIIKTVQIVSSECISEKKYTLLVKNLNLNTILYSDYSNKVAYFIFE